MHVVIIDNYDSFTYNLSHLVKELGAEVAVFRNDRFELEDLARFDKIILSPGPGIPGEAGLLLDVIRHYAGQKPILGVCLGHQAIGEVFGARLQNISQVADADGICHTDPARVFHGVATPAHITVHDYIFDGLPETIEIGRYHSWVVDAGSIPAALEVTAVSDEGQVMALRHRQHDIRGIQFHPESVLTPHGHQILANWLGH